MNDAGKEWRRWGRGHNFQFFATDEEIIEILTTYLPLEYAPYEIVRATLVKGAEKYVQVPFYVPWEALLDYVNQHIQNEWQDFSYWIGSKTLTHTLLQDEPRTSFASYGLIQVRHGGKVSRKYLTGKRVVRNVSSIGITNRVYDIETGEIKEYSEYFKIYNRLKRRLQKILTHTSIISFPSGSTLETRDQKMTSKVVELYHQGIPYANAPGTKIR